MLIIIDEIDRRSISQALDARVAMLKEEERSETLDQKELEKSLEDMDNKNNQR